MKNPYDNDYGIELKAWSDGKDSEFEKRYYYATIYPWSYNRRIIERDGLISLQVTVHPDDRGCWNCKDRIAYTTRRFAEENVRHFWTREPDDGFLYVTVGPLPPHRSVEDYLTVLLVLPVHIYPSPGKTLRSRRQSKGRRRQAVH